MRVHIYLYARAREPACVICDMQGRRGAPDAKVFFSATYLTSLYHYYPHVST